MADGVQGHANEVTAWPEDRTGIRIKALQPTNESLKFTIPAALKPSAWLFRVETSTGRHSRPVRLNCPTVYWLQGDRGLRSGSPGGWLRLFGRAVGWPHVVGRVRLKLADHNELVDLQPVDGSLWSIQVSLPERLESGLWTVFVHNGLGGEQGWTRAGELKIAAPITWPTQVFNVRDFGATGRGSLRDGLAIDAALAKAGKAGGGVVYFPRGQYRLGHTLTIPPFTELRGESTTLVSLFWPDTDTPYVLVEGTHHFGLQDLTLYASNYTHVIAGSIGRPDSGHVFVRRVRVRADIYRGHLKPQEVDWRFRASLKSSTGGGDTIRLGGPGIEVSNCDLYGSGRSIFLLKARGARVVNNRLYNGRWGWYSFSGSNGLIFEKNTLTGADLMSTGGGINNLYGATASQNVYYGDNTLSLMHGWDREAMTSDAGGGAYYGRVTQVSPDTIHLVGKPDWSGGRQRWKGTGVFILAGRGMGQYRQVVDVADDERTVTLDHPLDVSLDASTIVTVTMLQQNYLFINNHFTDAGIALQYYGTTVNCVAAGNTSTRAGGFYNSGRWYHGFQPSWYCQFLGNEILEGNGYRFGPNNSQKAGNSLLGTWGVQSGANTAPLAYCAVHRRNRLHNNAFISLKGISREHPGLRDVVVEHNTIENSRIGIRQDDGCVGLLLRKNTFHQVEYEHLDSTRLRQQLAAKRAKLIGAAKPVYYQSFDRRNGRLFPDNSGNHFLAEATNGPVSLVAGVAGRAGRFDGKSYLLVADDDHLLDFPRMTISAWIRPDYDHGRWGVVARRVGNVAAPYILAINGKSVEFEATDSTDAWSYNVTSPQPVLRPGQWNHIAVTCDDGKRILLYCNGQRVNEKTVSHLRVQNNNALTIGYEAWGGESPHAKTSGNFQGLIDEVKIWSRILTPQEIQQQYKALATVTRVKR